MDTGTHIVMGFGLAGLAALDPALAQHPVTAQAVIFGTVIGSVTPDIDTVLKLKNNAVYIRHHRGITHSLPATILWPLILTAGLIPIFPNANILHLWIWTFLAVFIHVFVDIFNSYGTQALRPLSYQWIALDVINIFDPFIFGLHIAGFAIWFFFGHSGMTFLCIYVLLFLYYLFRIFHHHRAASIVKGEISDARAIFLSPTWSWTQYHMAVKTQDKQYVGEIKGNVVTTIDTFERHPIPDHPAIEIAKKDKNISAFLSFSPIYRWQLIETEDYYEVRFIDLRYLSNGHYPFVAIAWIDKSLHIKSSFTGWVYSEAKLKKKLTIATDDC